MSIDMVRRLEKADIELIDLADAKAAWRAFRLANGFSGCPPLLSAEDTNMKLHKSQDKLSITTYGLSLSPAKASGYNVCRFATKCADACVAHSGNGRYIHVGNARKVKTQFLGQFPSEFITLLVNEIDKAVVKNGTIAVRLNTFSDLPWETLVPWLFDRWTEDQVSFYDYTKWPTAQRPGIQRYDLTRSANEKQTDAQVVAMLTSGERVAACIDWPKKGEIPTSYLGFPVIDGDKHDARFTEPKGVVVLLRPKGTARRDGFVRPYKENL